MKVRKNGATFEITGIVDAVVARRFLRSCGFTIVDDLLARATELRTGADGAVAEESPKNLRTEDSDAGDMGEAG